MRLTSASAGASSGGPHHLVVLVVALRDIIQSWLRKHRIQIVVIETAALDALFLFLGNAQAGPGLAQATRCQ